MASEQVRAMAREHPQAFENVAKACGGELETELLSVLHEERQTEPDRVKPTAD